MPPLEELWTLVRCIPEGCASTYGELGRALKYPASGYFVGRWMAQCPEDTPWWRVVAKSGYLTIGKRSPELAVIQLQRLHEEGIELEGERIASSALLSAEELMSLRDGT